MDSIKLIFDSWNKNGTIKSVVNETGYSWNKIVKTLSSLNIIINDTHSAILEYHRKGCSVAEIADLMDLNIRTVQAYIPRSRPIYGENQSENAHRIAKCRLKKKSQNKM